MDQRSGSPDWINAFLEWTDNDAAMSGQPFAISRVEALDDERRAWQTLSALRIGERRRARIGWDEDSRMDWPGALESIEADMRALSGRILELRAH